MGSRDERGRHVHSVARSDLHDLDGRHVFDGVHTQGCIDCMVNPVWLHNFSDTSVSNIYLEMGLLTALELPLPQPLQLCDHCRGVAWAAMLDSSPSQAYWPGSGLLDLSRVNPHPHPHPHPCHTLANTLGHSLALTIRQVQPQSTIACNRAERRGCALATMHGDSPP